jgi:hypothetical protein
MVDTKFSVLGEGGVLISLLGHMRLIYGRLLEGVGGSSLVILDLGWKMALRLVFSMICGLGISLLRLPSQIYLALRVKKMLLLWNTLEFSGGSTY